MIFDPFLRSWPQRPSFQVRFTFNSDQHRTLQNRRFVPLSDEQVDGTHPAHGPNDAGRTSSEAMA